MKTFQKAPGEREMLQAVVSKGLALYPLWVQQFRATPCGTEIDGVLDLAWEGNSFRFALECTGLSTPKALAVACDVAIRAAGKDDGLPMVLAPYLSPEALAVLRERNVSGIDLCGNLLLVVPGRLYVERSGAANRFPRSGPIKNVYRKASSVVARAFLLVPEFASVSDALEEINRREGLVTLSTVSKVCQQLEADLVIERTKEQQTPARRLRLLQPDKLFDLLRDNYTPPRISERVSAKLTRPWGEVAEILRSWKSLPERTVVQTGESSADRYAVLAKEPTVSLYCSSVKEVLAALGPAVRLADRFADLNLLETVDEKVYFDPRENLSSSPVQTYLELATADKRAKETAEQVRRWIQDTLSGKEAKVVTARPPQDEPARPRP